eukprot:c36841_g1_i1.p1 GENE.c36841_g1_i1~~c36841_g1_i1.p1  ORF type:complete len:369 (+),score=163.24 c36841_g1_i1:31-1107(+)
MATVASGGRTAVLHGVSDVRLEQLPIPTPGDKDVLIRVACVGICGSDLSYYYKCEIGGHVFKFPDIHQTNFRGIMGHEASGQIVGVGKSVTNFAIGDRVAMEPGVPCGFCPKCLKGHYNLCPKLEFLGSYLSNHSGALCEYIIHPASFCFKLPESVSYADGALMEPLSVGLHAVQRANISIGDKVLITGAGPVGLLTLLAVKSCGITSITITDINDNRLAKAKELGANVTVNVSTNNNSSEQLIDNTFDVSIDCTGVESSIETCIRCTDKGGRVVLVGMGPMKVELRTVQIKELNVMGVFRYRNVYQKALDLLSSKKIDVSSLVSHHYDLDDVNQAFEAAKKDVSAVKVVIHPNKDLR